ncbi:MAG: hypothetical protein K9J17_18380 [Flavobacteriales bacterium]|nr:hypothetical protein [Flavobacteriales bacterium]
MKLRIDNSKKISEVQEQFSAAFPYLKIEFFKKPHAAGEMSPMQEMVSSNADLKDWKTVDTEGVIEINGESTVRNIEKEFQEHYGMSAQVFRKSGEVWLETSVTDSWTLKEQNEQGMFMDEEVGS